MTRSKLIIYGLLVTLALAGCSQKKKPEDGPPKDHFRSIKLRVYDAQQMVLTGDLGLIDSVLVPQLRGKPEGAQAFLDFVDGGDPSFQFGGFINYEIFHIEDVARVDLDIEGADSTDIRRATFTFNLIDSIWYLERWETGITPLEEEVVDSVS